MKPEPGNKYRFILPLYVTLPRKTKKDKRIPLTMNWYRNAQHFESNAVKQQFKPIYSDPWEGEAPKIRVSYYIQKMTRARFDTGNFTACIDKFFLDYLVNRGMIKDDDFSRVCYGGADGINGQKKNRCLAFVEILPNDGLQIKV